MLTRSRAFRRSLAMMALASVLAIVPLSAQADGEPRGGPDHMQEGCEIPGSGDGLGDTLALVTRLTCG